MEPPDKKRASKADTRVIQLGITTPDPVDKNESDVKTVPVARRGKKQSVVIKRDDEEDAFR